MEEDGVSTQTVCFDASLISILFLEITYGNPVFLVFLCGRKTFFNSRDDINFLIFPRGRQKKRFFVNLILFLSNVVTFFEKKQTS